MPAIATCDRSVILTTTPCATALLADELENSRSPICIFTSSSVQQTSARCSTSSAGQYMILHGSMGTSTTRIPMTTTSNTTVWSNVIVSSNGYGFYAAYSPTIISPEESAQRARTLQILRRSRELKAKSSIKRALKLMANFGMDEDVRVFMSGGLIEISHPESLFKFVLKKSRHLSVIDKTIYPGCSTPYKLELYTKSNVRIADLCVYMDDTPILDHILALSMFIKTGDEEAILRKANFLCRNVEDVELLTSLSDQHPYLSKKFHPY